MDYTEFINSQNVNFTLLSKEWLACYLCPLFRLIRDVSAERANSGSTFCRDSAGRKSSVVVEKLCASGCHCLEFPPIVCRAAGGSGAPLGQSPRQSGQRQSVGSPAFVWSVDCLLSECCFDGCDIVRRPRRVGSWPEVDDLEGLLWAHRARNLHFRPMTARWQMGAQRRREKVAARLSVSVENAEYAARLEVHHLERRSSSAAAKMQIRMKNTIVRCQMKACKRCRLELQISLFSFVSFSCCRQSHVFC